MERIGWKLLSPYFATDHRGQRWQLSKDPPAAIAKAVQHSVRAWRLQRLIQALLGLAPEYIDVCAPLDSPSLLVDFGFALKALVKGKSAKSSAGWLSEWAPYLISALSGGQ